MMIGVDVKGKQDGAYSGHSGEGKSDADKSSTTDNKGKGLQP